AFGPSSVGRSAPGRATSIQARREMGGRTQPGRRMLRSARWRRAGARRQYSGSRVALQVPSGSAPIVGSMCDGDRYDDRVTEIIDAALERGYMLAFRQRAGGWEAAWRPTAAAPVSAAPAFGATRTAPAGQAPAPVRAAA